MIGAPGLTMALLAPFAGLAVDRFGRRRLLLICTALYGVSGSAPLLLDDLDHIYASRLLLGVSEAGILTMMDITTDGLGFMLTFGDIAWLPFLYSTQTRYLSTYPVTLGPIGLALVEAGDRLQRGGAATDPDHPERLPLGGDLDPARQRTRLADRVEV